MKVAGICMDNLRTTGAFVDWLSLSFPPNVQIETLEQLLQGLVLPGELIADKGGDGYKSSYRNFDRSIVLLVNGGHEKMGPHLRLTGKSCERLQENLFQLASQSIALGAKIARLDLSVDEHAGVLDLDEVQAALKDGCLTSKYRKEPRVEEFYNSQTGKVVGKIIRFGSRTGKVSIRFYDKAMQQGKDFRWLRIEIELKKKAAQQAVEDWIFGTTLDELFFGVLSSYLKFRQRGNGRNRSRWPLAPWWEEFLEQVGRGANFEAIKATFRFRRDPPKDGLDWFLNNCDKLAARAEKHYGSDIFRLMVESGNKKLAVS